VVDGAGDARVIASGACRCRFDEQSARRWALREGPSGVAETLRDGDSPSEQIARQPRFRSSPAHSLRLRLLGASPSSGRAGCRRRRARPLGRGLAPWPSPRDARLALRQRRFTDGDRGEGDGGDGAAEGTGSGKERFVSVVATSCAPRSTALQGFTELPSLARVPARARGAVLEPPPWRSGAAGRIVAELLDLSRIESGRPLELRREPVGRGRVSRANVELFAARTGAIASSGSQTPGGRRLHAGSGRGGPLPKN